ncbi:hypothetical protein Acor_63240 [Acrocarpospora corrugata]|uniref:Uncharacterized protein n=1 Tax=Acrocarpospora corrugata TaxID=35763 RepID=A0A5M3W656_9ACTN|nr:hypothetical protein [Acrocarpospora corrugata]GES04256.1 hypothetical protein Acor_63240 [Acrocarpospora corrugata]
MRVRVWRIVGGLFTAIVVISVAMAVRGEILWQGGLDGSAYSPLRSSQRTEIVTDVYDFAERTLIVRAGGNVKVNVVPGPDGRLTIRRELSWTDMPPNARQFWNGRTLRIEVSCRVGCSAVYTLSVPAAVEVERL